MGGVRPPIQVRVVRSPNSGWEGCGLQFRWRGAASISGGRGAASNSARVVWLPISGWRGAASNSGESGAASNSGESGAAFTIGS